MNKSCSKCGRPRDQDGQRYCRKCHTGYMRKWRLEDKLTDVIARHLAKLPRAEAKRRIAQIHAVTERHKRSNGVCDAEIS